MGRQDSSPKPFPAVRKSISVFFESRGIMVFPAPLTACNCSYGQKSEFETCWEGFPKKRKCGIVRSKKKDGLGNSDFHNEELS
jgi:hypothetical protein